MPPNTFNKQGAKNMVKMVIILMMMIMLMKITKKPEKYKLVIIYPF